MIHINATIAVEDAPSVAAFVSAAWIQALLHKSESDFLDFYASDRIAAIEALGTLVSSGEFHLSLLGELIGFNESNDNLGVIIASYSAPARDFFKPAQKQLPALPENEKNIALAFLKAA